MPIKLGTVKISSLIGDTSGVYRVRLAASEPHAPVGRYEITLRDIGAATEKHKARVAAGNRIVSELAVPEHADAGTQSFRPYRTATR
jgi:hypothetical protein